MNTEETMAPVSAPRAIHPRRTVEVRRLTMAAMLGTVAFALMYFNLSIPLISLFAEFDLSALPELLGGFILGPLGALLIVLVKIALILVFKGTTSMFTGEVQNFLLSVAYVLPAVFYYRRHRTKKGAMIGLLLGSVCSIVIAVFTNLYLIFPAYIYLSTGQLSWDKIIAMCHDVNPWIRDLPTFAAFSVVPFNLISRSLTSMLTLITYKKISVPLKKLIQ